VSTPHILPDLHAGSLVRLLRGTLESATSYSYTAGSTHHFYHYPARFAAPIARTVISELSSPGDWILDPFMGGGTSIIEALSLGRRAIGVDINALARFVADVRTRPISEADEIAIRKWARVAARELGGPNVDWVQRARVHNLPNAVGLFMSGALDYAEDLLPRQQAFARCALLRLGQWCLDCRDFDPPRRKMLAAKLPALVDEMIAGLREFVAACHRAGYGRRDILRGRVLLRRSAVGMDDEHRIQGLAPKLVLTSPPYPGVNVLYHRWQYRGRKETPAPYWIANVSDGCGASFYTGGSRTPTGLENYFEMITAAFSSVARVLHEDGCVVQLIGFSDARTQLPRYLQSMRKAGFKECRPRDGRLGRLVPNRKWYAKLQGQNDASTEVLLLHRLAT
jgi:hypothetical protein